MNTHTTTVLLSELRAITTFASLDASRYVLMGVNCEIQQDKTLLVATDGRRLAVIRSLAFSDNQKPASFTIPTSLITRMANAKRKAKPNENDVAVTYDAETFAITLSHRSRGYSVSGKSIEGAYPGWRGVLPKQEPPNGGMKAWSASVAYLGDMLKVGRAMGLREPHIVTFRQHDELAPIEARFSEADNFYAVIMPVKPTNPPEQFKWLFKEEAK